MITFNPSHSPDFLIIGAQKCGTTSLFYYLSQHPDLNLPKTKEIHFFDLNFEKEIEWYYNFFPKQSLLKTKFTGEASPYYLFHPLVPERVFKHLPKVKLIVLLRNPIDRAYSHFMHQQTNIRNEPISDFEEAISMEKTRIENQEEKLISGELIHSENFQHFTYISRGLYYKQINNWLRYFSMNQILFIKSEDFFEHPTLVLNEVYDFLKIRRKLPQSLTPQNTNDYPKIADSTKENLHKFFEEDSIKLKGLLGDEFSWK